MTKTCSVAGCKTNYQKKENGKTIITNPGTVFVFPDEEKKPELRRKWVRFCNQKYAFKITVNCGICENHFDQRFVKHGERKRLVWGQEDPMPTVYAANINIPPSVLPTTPTTRRPPTDRSQPDQLNDFRRDDMIKSLSDITDSVCPTGYKLEVHDGKAAILYKLEPTLNEYCRKFSAILPCRIFSESQRCIRIHQTNQHYGGRSATARTNLTAVTASGMLLH
jgi:hypothetical protein